MKVRRLDANYDMTFGQGRANLADGPESVAQRVHQRLLLLKGEWFLDTDDGVPYLQEIMVKPANMPRVEYTIKRRILGTEGVSEIREFNMSLNRDTRKLQVEATVATEFGTTFGIKEFYDV